MSAQAATLAPEQALRYSTVAIILHWAIAALILFNLATGLFLFRLPPLTIVLHISSGITILALSVVRVGWRWTHPRPPYPAGFAAWEERSAGLVHVLLYVLMLAMPLSGWALISANPPAGSPGAAIAAAEREAHHQPPRATGGPPIWFLFTLPLVKPINEIGRYPAGMAEQRALHDRLGLGHAVGGWTMLALFFLHVAGALKHQLIDRHRELARMGIGRARPEFGGT